MRSQTMSVKSIAGRVAALEVKEREQQTVYAWQNHDETGEQAIERWRAEHPDQDPSNPSINVVLIGWGAPQ